MTSLNFECPDCGMGPLRFCKGARVAPIGDVRAWDSCPGRMRLADVLRRPVSDAITLWQPWSWVIAHGGVLAKRIENRDWPPPADIIGKRLAIHAGQVTDVDAVEYLTYHMGFEAAMTERKRGKPIVTSMSTVDGDENPMAPIPLRSGAIESVGTVLGAVHDSGKVVGMSGVTDMAIKLIQQDPYFSGEWGWFLVDVVTLPEPVMCKGSRKIWTLDEPTRAAVRHQLEKLAA